jgi:hypothetical protein
MFSTLIDLHTNIYQQLWNLLVITPTTNVDACLSDVYAGIDGLNLVLKHHQHKQSHRTVTLLSRLWVRSYPPYRYHMEIPKIGDV